MAQLSILQEVHAPMDIRKTQQMFNRQFLEVLHKLLIDVFLDKN